MKRFLSLFFIGVMAAAVLSGCNTAESGVPTDITAETSAELISAETSETADNINESENSSDDELDFWACPNPDSGYIITDSANSLTLEKLYSLICKARYYMMSSNDCYLDDEGQWQVIRIGYTGDPITYEDFVVETSQKYKQIFTNRLVDNIPKPNDEDYERGMYVYSLGFLSGSDYGYGNDRGTDATYCMSDWQIEIVSDTEVRLIHQAFYSVYPEWTEGDEPVYFKDHVLLNQADDSVHELRTLDNRSERLETYYYTLLWEDEHWKFDSFSLWY